MLLNSKNKRPQSAFPLRKPSTSFSGLENAKKVNIESGEFNNIPLLENKDTIRNMVDVKTNSILVKVSGEPPLLVELKRFIRNELKELNAEW
ncbi:hypothetical protein HMI55_003670 [Coelomomyces lativittatus]|nr:hypothetical protein HMI55_003670 [Coelomomyces lativittatus]